MPHTEIRILSVRQPYADEIIFGDKWNELRSRSTPYRGHVYIHASRWDISPAEGSPGEGTTGAIIGRVTLVDCVDEHDLSIVEDHLCNRKTLPEYLIPLAKFLKKFPRKSWEHGLGDANWIFTDPVPLVTPLKTGGKLNLWRGTFAETDLAVRADFRPPQGPTATEYVNWDRPEIIYEPIREPSTSAGTAMFKCLKPLHANGAAITEKLLKPIARKINTTTDQLRQALKNNREFERVPGKPLEEDWWRVRQKPIERRRSDLRRDDD
jgi:hypothetical protein